VLTNDWAYAKPSSSESTASDLAFRIGEGAVIEGKRAWGKLPAGAGDRPDIELTGRYEMHWTEYSTFGNGAHLWLLVVEVPGSSGI
jgi:hypothetical protein